MPYVAKPKGFDGNEVAGCLSTNDWVTSSADNRVYSREPDKILLEPATTSPTGALYRQAVLASIGATGLIPATQGITGGINAAIAAHSADNYSDVSYRSARVGDTIYIDMTNGRGELSVLRIKRKSVELLRGAGECGVARGANLVRNRRQGAMVTPDLEATFTQSIDAFASLFPQLSRESILMVWLWAAYVIGHPNSPTPVLNLGGAAGNGKSAIMDTLIMLIDNVAGRKGSNLGIRMTSDASDSDLVSVAQSGWLLALDNMSDIRGHSDMLTSLSTGGTMAKRALYTDVDMTASSMMRPTIITAIDLLGAGSDLVSRCVDIDISQAPDRDLHWEDRRNALLPVIYGGMLQYVSFTIDREPEKLTTTARMKEWGGWLSLYDEISGSEVAQAYEDAQTDAQRDTAESSSGLTSFVEYVESGGVTSSETWTMTDLLKRLRRYDSDARWPETGRGLSNMLKRSHAALQANGIDYELAGPRGQRKLYRVLASAPTANVPDFNPAPPIPEQRQLSALLDWGD
jgi:hypothetical protein